MPLNDVGSPWIASLVSVVLAALGIAAAEFLERRIARLIKNMEPLQEGRRKQLLTLVGTVRWVVVAVVVASVTLMVLSHFVDVTPVLASVGVIGLALSLGAQTLIKDVLGGLFILIENQYAVGDVVEIGEVSGQVERITLRSTSIRDIDGSLHLVPNGDVRIVSNLTREWSRALVDFGVAYEEDLDEVLAVLRDLAEALAADEEFGPLLIGTPEVIGPVSLEDTTVVVRVMATTKPGAQWTIGRVIQKRVLQVCDEAGIELPYPRQEVVIRREGFPAAGGEET
jgi:small conductance mechanosensitive channel